MIITIIIIIIITIIIVIILLLIFYSNKWIRGGFTAAYYKLYGQKIK